MTKSGRGRNKAGLSRHRSANAPSVRPRILIACEGEKTEPNYFVDVRRRFEKVSDDLCVVLPECGVPMSVVRRAKKEKKAAKYEGRPFDEVWVVFDRDEHPDVENAIQMARANKFGIAFSNPCFELWYLLHFQNQTGFIDRHAAERTLREHIDGYDKNLKDLYATRLHDKEDEATTRAEGLQARYEKDEQDTAGKKKWSDTNPFTTVDRLLKALSEAYSEKLPQKPAPSSPCAAEDGGE